MSTTHPRRSEAGFTLIEMMIAVCMVGLLASMAVLQLDAIRPGVQGDGAMRTVMSQLNLAREKAIAHRREIEVTFVGTNMVRLIRHEVPVVNGTTVLATVGLEGGVRFGLLSGIPDTPDTFGNGSATDFGAALMIKFNTEGMLVDSGGSPVNGTVFLAIPGAKLSYRAVTILGATGRVRGYRWDGHAWKRV